MQNYYIKIIIKLKIIILLLNYSLHFKTVKITANSVFDNIIVGLLKDFYLRNNIINTLL